ncbi:IucA/IucC family C-terminal-domain containing protein [Staphylospora marina]|uniref:IucA/IucC family C-terminal-domain containing protein n=1 Tax=Staphylospora marina TaxID=2490858 RepID=UPI000F5BA778|nr:IucA/IucC family C-terminal-domain containing protein [Staphylospora marina]
MLMVHREEKLSELVSNWPIRIGREGSAVRERTDAVRGEWLESRSRLAGVLDSIGKKWGSPNSKVTASLLIKAYALIPFAMRCISFADLCPRIDFSRLSLSVKEQWLEFELEDETADAFETGNRDAWRAERVAALFKDHLTVLIRRLQETTRIPADVLWAHVAFNLDYWYGVWQEQVPPGERRDILLGDREFLFREASPELFGWHVNPLNIRFREMDIPDCPGATIRVRSKCCLYYRLPGKLPCYTCPKLTDEGRSERWRETMKR